jgi:hypothetical protein
MISAKRENNVFFNCSFDGSYAQIFEAVVFAVFDFGFLPRCSLEVSDSTQSRLSRIVDLIRKCNYAVHDISYTELDSRTQLPRFNMPFELGLYFGCQNYGGKFHGKKTSLILDRDPYRYRAFLSDISGQDIRPHGGDPRAAVKEVRDWVPRARLMVEPLTRSASSHFQRTKKSRRVVACAERGRTSKSIFAVGSFAAIVPMRFPTAAGGTISPPLVSL